MPTDLVMLLVTAVLAVMALVAAGVAVRAARRSAHGEPAEPEPPVPAVVPERLPRSTALVPLDPVLDEQEPDEQLAPRSVEGRVIVPPTGQQVVGAALSRPHVRLAVVLHGLTYALRPESRDRITALVRREYRRRRRERLAAGRRAVRAAQPPPADSWTTQPWMGELTTGSRSKVES